MFSTTIRLRGHALNKVDVYEESWGRVVHWGFICRNFGAISNQVIEFSHPIHAVLWQPRQSSNCAGGWSSSYFIVYLQAHREGFSMKCPRCGNEWDTNKGSCSRCGYVIRMTGKPRGSSALSPDPFSLGNLAAGGF